MPNGNDMTDAIQFEDKLNDLTGDELGRFIARQLYQHCEEQKGYGSRIEALEGRGNKFAGAVGGTSAIIGGAIVYVIDWFTKRGSS